MNEFLRRRSAAKSRSSRRRGDLSELMVFSDSFIKLARDDYQMRPFKVLQQTGVGHEEVNASTFCALLVKLMTDVSFSLFNFSSFLTHFGRTIVIGPVN